jgi:hypothetical protein
MTAGQLASYDQAKMMLLATKVFKDDPVTHFTYVRASYNHNRAQSALDPQAVRRCHVEADDATLEKG